MLKKWGLCIAACVILTAGAAFAADDYYIGAVEKSTERNSYVIRPMFVVDFKIFANQSRSIEVLPNNFASIDDFANAKRKYPSYLAGSYACLSDQQGLTGKFSDIKRPWKYDTVAAVGTYKLSGVSFKNRENSCLMTSDRTDIRIETKEERNSFQTEGMISSIKEISDTINNLKANGLYDVNTDAKTYSFYSRGKVYIAIVKISANPINNDDNLQPVKKIFVIAKKQQTYKIVAAYDGSDAVELIAVIDSSLIPWRLATGCDCDVGSETSFAGKREPFLMLRNENPANVTYVLLGMDKDVGVTSKYEYTYKKP